MKEPTQFNTSRILWICDLGMNDRPAIAALHVIRVLGELTNFKTNKLLWLLRQRFHDYSDCGLLCNPFHFLQNFIRFLIEAQIRISYFIILPRIFNCYRIHHPHCHASTISLGSSEESCSFYAFIISPKRLYLSQTHAPVWQFVGFIKINHNKKLELVHLTLLKK